MRIGLISDIHANYSALESVLFDMEKVGFDLCICLGDVVGYGPDPSECINLINEKKIPCLMGNHDAAVCGFLDIEYFNIYAKKALEWTISNISSAEIDLIKGYCEKKVLDNIVMIHGALTNQFDYILNKQNLDQNSKILIEEYGGKNICCFGHTHIAFSSYNNSFNLITESLRIYIKNFNKDIVFINPGSVGQPRGGNSKNAFYCILNTETGEINYRSVKYDVKRTYKKIIEKGLPKFLAERLITGY